MFDLCDVMGIVIICHMLQDALLHLQAAVGFSATFIRIYRNNLLLCPHNLNLLLLHVMNFLSMKAKQPELSIHWDISFVCGIKSSFGSDILYLNIVDNKMYFMLLLRFRTLFQICGMNVSPWSCTEVSHMFDAHSTCLVDLKRNGMIPDYIKLAWGEITLSGKMIMLKRVVVP